MKLSVCIPCYKSSQTISKVVSDIVEEMKSHKQKEYEIILVNDGSSDNTYEVIEGLAKKNSHIIAINLAKNFGQSAALLCAYSRVTGDVIVTMDDDGEHNPKDIFTLVNKLNEGYDYVCADFYNYNRAAYKSLGSKFNYWFLAKMMDIPKDTLLSAYSVTRKYVIDEIIKYKNPRPYVDGFVWNITNKVTSVPVEHSVRIAGESGYNLKNSIALWANGVTSYSIKPLRIATISGFAFAFVGFISIIVVLIHRLLHPEDVEGWASLLTVVLFIGGLLMIFLGLIGEYVGRQYLISNSIPQYVVRDEYHKADKH